MLPRALVLLALSTAAAGCFTESTLATSRGRIWAQPGDAPVFVWLVRDRTTTTRSLGLGGGHKRSDEFPIEFDWDKSTGTYADRTWVIAIDPATGRSTQLARTKGAVDPFYWDARRGVLWVQGAEDRRLSGLTPTGVVRPGSAKFVTAPNLPPPFAVWYGGQSAKLYNVQTTTELSLEPEATQGVAHVEGSRLRLGRIEHDGNRIGVRQTVIDWAGAAPVRLPDVTWSSPLLPSDGVRIAQELALDGARLVEIVHLTGGNRMVVHDLSAASPPRVIAIPAPAEADAPAPASGAAAAAAPAAPSNAPGALPAAPAPVLPEEVLELVAIDPDTFLVLEPKRSNEDRTECRRGYIAALSQARLTPLPAEPCVLGVQELFGATHAWLELRGYQRFAYVDRSGAVVDLGENVRDALALTPSTFVFARGTKGKAELEILKLELPSGALTRLGARARGRLINVRGDTLIFLENGHIVTQRAGAPPDAPAAAPIELPTRVSR